MLVVIMSIYFTGCMRAGGTITLLKGPFNIIVDTGSPWDKDIIIKGIIPRVIIAYSSIGCFFMIRF